MERRVSIGRLMLAIGMFALAMTLLRAWLSPKNSFGFFGRLLCWIMLAGVAQLVTSGSLGRFLAGTTLTAIFLGFASFIRCDWILPRTAHQVVIPIESWFSDDLGSTTPTGMTFLTNYDLRPPDSNHQFWVGHRLFFYSGLQMVQLKILLPQVSLSALVGLVFVACGRRQTVPPRAAEKP